MTAQDARRPVISFLTPAYRTEAYLPATIESVLTQTLDAWQLVVVDNGCSDEVAAIVSSYDDPRLLLVRQENDGYTGGVMAAAAVATGDFVCVLDSDDQLTPSFVRVMVDQVRSHPDVGAIGCDATLFRDEDGETFGRGYLHSIGARTPARGGQPLTVEDVLGGQVPYYSGAVRRDAWTAVGGYRPGVEGIDESVLIWLRLAQRFEVRVLPDRLCRYRVRDDSLSHDPAKVEHFEQQLIGTFELFAESFTDPAQARLVEAPLRRLRYHRELRRARQAFADGDDAAARTSARRALGHRRTPRAGVVLLMLRLSPGLLRRLHPHKQRAAEVARRAVRRVRR